MKCRIGLNWVVVGCSAVVYSRDVVDCGEVGCSSRGGSSAVVQMAEAKAAC